MMWWMPAGMLMMGLFWVLVVAAIAAAIWWLVA